MYIQLGIPKQASKEAKVFTLVQIHSINNIQMQVSNAAFLAEKTNTLAAVRPRHKQTVITRPQANTLLSPRTQTRHRSAVSSQSLPSSSSPCQLENIQSCTRGCQREVPVMPHSPS